MYRYIVLCNTLKSVVYRGNDGNLRAGNAGDVNPEVFHFGSAKEAADYMNGILAGAGYRDKFGFVMADERGNYSVDGKLYRI